MSDFSDETYLSSDGLALHFRHYPGPGDDAPVIICIPGITRNSRDFDDIARHLSDRFQLVCVELRGRGDSAWDPNPENYHPTVYLQDILDLLHYLGLAKAIFLGTSLGGLMTMALSVQHGDKIQAAILNDIGGKLETKGLTRIQQAVASDKSSVITWDDAAIQSEALLKAVFPHYDKTDWAVFARKTYRENDKGIPVPDYDPAIIQNFSKAAVATATDYWHFFDGLNGIPTLVLRGELSDFLAHDTVREMTRRNADCVAQTVPGVGHTPMLIEPESVKAIDSFLDAFA